MKKGTKWTREETIVAFYVYCIIPFASSSKTNPTVIYYANILGRSPSALNMKIGNIGRLDPELKKKNITGLSHGAKIEEIVWDEFEDDRENLVYEAEKIIEKLSKKSLETSYLKAGEINYSSENKIRLVKTRVNQNFFRSSVLSAYNNTCAITGIKINDYLVASHIKPWAQDKENRLNPHNGICLNSIHDKAFDKGHITINKDYRIIVSNKLKEFYTNKFIEDVFKKYEGHKILIPNKFEPSKEFLEYHNDVIFVGD
ncbi:MAG: HNH endonuclease [Methanosarcinaceae archaeon]|nr:HNH endonuclease [Methanosarcinaceae archaeon]